MEQKNAPGEERGSGERQRRDTRRARPHHGDTAPRSRQRWAPASRAPAHPSANKRACAAAGRSCPALRRGQCARRAAAVKRAREPSRCVDRRLRLRPGGRASSSPSAQHVRYSNVQGGYTQLQGCSGTSASLPSSERSSSLLHGRAAAGGTTGGAGAQQRIVDLRLHDRTKRVPLCGPRRRRLEQSLLHRFRQARAPLRAAAAYAPAPARAPPPPPILPLLARLQQALPQLSLHVTNPASASKARSWMPGTV